jgi:membrane-associated phospholipid phosphatase
VELITWALKLAVDRPRATGVRVVAPYLSTTLDPSFPIGHASRAFASAALLGHRMRRWRWLLGALATGIGFSRIYLGVHYPSDVLAGALLGLGAAAAYLLLADRWRPLAEFRKRALEVLGGLLGKLGERPEGVEDLRQGGRSPR